MLSNKSCPLFKSTLPVYFVGIISTIVDIELYGSLNLNSNEGGASLEIPAMNFNFSNSNSPTSNRNLNSSSKTGGESSSESLSIVDKRLNYMSNYLRNVFFTLSLNQSNLDGLIAIYEQMK